MNRSRSVEVLDLSRIITVSKLIKLVSGSRDVNWSVIVTGVMNCC